MECSKCGAIGGKLFDVISGEGIVKVCKRCLAEENVPIIRKPTQQQIDSINKDETLYNRLSQTAGLDAEEHKKNIFGSEQKKELIKQEATLRDLVDKRFDKFVKEKVEKRDDLIDNFHWIIMRARRNKKMTIPHLAQEIGETEKVIKLAEQGILPKGDYKIVRKLERILGINILKPEISERLEMQRKQLGFDETTTKELTISDLQEMKKDEIVREQKEPYWRRVMSKLIKKENPEMNVEFVEINGENVPKAPGFEKEEEFKEDDTFEFEDMKKSEIEFDDTSLEMINTVPELDIEESKEEEKVENQRELTQDEIDDILYGR